MAYLTASEMNGTAALDLRVLAAGVLPMSALRTWRTEVSGDDLEAGVRRHRPDLLVLDAALATPGLAAMLGEPDFSDLPVILVTGDADTEAAGLLLDRPLLLVDKPADPDRLTAAVARAVERRVSDGAGRFIEDRLAALRRDAERVAAALQDITGGQPPEPVRPVTAQRIRAHIRGRRLRERFFAPDLFADAAWDVLLDLSAARLEERPVSVSSLCIAAAVPTTTALRTIKQLVDRGLLERRSDPTDARRTFIAMTAQTGRAMEACLEAVLNGPGQ